MTEPTVALATICRRNGLQLDEARLLLLRQYVDLLLEWNTRINLVSRADTENIWFSHILHCLSILFYVEIPPGARILDIGTGGGFPGIPMAIARPDISVVLLDSIRKKTTAVQNMVDTLALTGVTVWTGRAEEMSHDPERKETFDFVLTRAVASLEDLARWSRPYLKKDGGSLSGEETKIRPPALVALKGGDLEKEIASARMKGHIRAVRVVPMSFPGSTSLGLEDKKLVAATF